MATCDLLTALAKTSLASSAAILIVLVLRREVRRHFGAVVVYGLWALVPVVIVAVLLPAVAASTESGVPGLARATPSMPVSVPLVSIDMSTWLVAVWLFGAVSMAALMVWRQCNYRTRLGHLRARADGLHEAETTAGLPAVIGVWRPIIVVPCDFDLRYSQRQKALIEAHERMHVASGDMTINAGVALLRCIYWFNPLWVLNDRHFRHDQELACDQRVLARNPRSRRAYAEAVMKTQLAFQPLPLGCHWSYSHPLRERIQMLKRPVPTSRQALAGMLTVASLTLAAGFSAWAAQPPRSTEVTPAPPMASPGDAASSPVSPASAAPSGTNIRSATALPLGPGESRTPPPKYPADAIAKHQQGRVVLVVDIDKLGHPTAVKVEKSSPPGVFDAVTVEAAMKWRFTPEIKDGRPIASRVRVPVDFSIPEDERAAPAASADS